MNPYWGAHFFSFFSLLFKRLLGGLPTSSPPSDEVQLFVLICLALSTAILGTFLTLRQMTMLANSLSHTSLLGIVLSFVFSLNTSSSFELKGSHVMGAHVMGDWLVVSSLLTAFLTVLITEGMRTVFKLQEDASIGLVFTTLFALGIVLVTLFTRNTHVGVEVITGNIDGLTAADRGPAAAVALTNLLLLLACYRPWALSAFDPTFAKACGLPVTGYHYIQMGLTALTFVLSIRVVGILLVLAFLVGPVLIARRWTHRLPSLLLLAMAVGVGFSLLGVALARHLLSTLQIAVSTGGCIASLLLIGYFICVALTFRRSNGLITTN